MYLWFVRSFVTSNGIAVIPDAVLCSSKGRSTHNTHSHAHTHQECRWWASIRSSRSPFQDLPCSQPSHSHTDTYAHTHTYSLSLSRSLSFSIIAHAARTINESSTVNKRGRKQKVVWCFTYSSRSRSRSSSRRGGGGGGGVAAGDKKTAWASISVYHPKDTCILFIFFLSFVPLAAAAAITARAWEIAPEITLWNSPTPLALLDLSQTNNYQTRCVPSRLPAAAADTNPTPGGEGGWGEEGADTNCGCSCCCYLLEKRKLTWEINIQSDQNPRAGSASSDRTTTPYQKKIVDVACWPCRRRKGKVRHAAQFEMRKFCLFLVPFGGLALFAD